MTLRCVTGKAHAGKAAGQGADCDLSLEASKLVSDAMVPADAKSDVATSLSALYVEAVGLDEGF
jgi:hypothetical protein